MQFLGLNSGFLAIRSLWITCILIFLDAMNVRSIEEYLGLYSASEFGFQTTKLELVYEGPHLSLYTSGQLIKQHKHSKSGIWNVPSRKLQEMWVKKSEAESLIRLEPKIYRYQLIDLVPDFPEIHEAILDREFSYKDLPNKIREFNDHIARVIIIRRNKVKSLKKRTPRLKIIG